MQVTTVQPDNLEQTAKLAGEAMAAGGLVVFPTETVYGLAASVDSAEGLSALREFKDRSDGQPFTVHLPGRDAVELYVDASDSTLQRLIRKSLPGPVTLVAEVTDDVIANRVRKWLDGGLFDGLSVDEVRDLLYHENTIGLRCPDHIIGQAILAATSGPVVATSANRRGDAPPRDVDEAVTSVGDAAAMVIDGGPCRFAKPSTIVRVRTGETMENAITVEREGVYDERIIKKMLKWTALMVCSGNTCRSPMAEGLARHMIARQRGINEADLNSHGLNVLSAGTFAMDGMPVSPEAVDVLQRQGIDISGHRSTALTTELIHQADVIYCMTRSHLSVILNSVPAVADRVFLIDPEGDIEDPIGGGVDVYDRCQAQIGRGLEQRLKEHLQ